MNVAAVETPSLVTTLRGPVSASSGTIATILVALHSLRLADSPLNLTSGFPPLELTKPVPVIVTQEPGTPLCGVNVAIRGRTPVAPPTAQPICASPERPAWSVTRIVTVAIPLSAGAVHIRCRMSAPGSRDPAEVSQDGVRAASAASGSSTETPIVTRWPGATSAGAEAIVRRGGWSSNVVGTIVSRKMGGNAVSGIGTERRLACLPGA
ncbi:MAG: hypothetical protein BWY66_01291 [bacterium ADurb.Bin374]|nr:MAG: hypothetical protein BWY66_01291 [bacterium ADurb.Bin374]